jgi:putative flippase GtrA
MTITTNSYGDTVSPSTLVRWCKFNIVGGIGIIVQFVALFLLKSVLHFNYLAATAIAVEAAVVHNFVWHEQFTWADRTKTDRTKIDGVQPSWRAEPPHGSGAKAQNLLSRLFAALRLCATQRLRGPQATSFRPSFRRLVRFNLTNGGVSILGNLALMKVMVEQGHMNYLLANAIAITLCSLTNFLVSETWVFGRQS